MLPACVVTIVTWVVTLEVTKIVNVTKNVTPFVSHLQFPCHVSPGCPYYPRKCGAILPRLIVTPRWGEVPYREGVYGVGEPLWWEGVDNRGCALHRPPRTSRTHARLSSSTLPRQCLPVDVANLPFTIASSHARASRSGDDVDVRRLPREGGDVKGRVGEWQATRVGEGENSQCKKGVLHPVRFFKKISQSSPQVPHHPRVSNCWPLLRGSFSGKLLRSNLRK